MTLCPLCHSRYCRKCGHSQAECESRARLHAAMQEVLPPKPSEPVKRRRFWGRKSA